MGGAEWIDAILKTARSSGALEAEAYVKSAWGRRVALHPAAADVDRRLTFSTLSERGVALRIRDGRGRWGFAWRSAGGEVNAAGLVSDALDSARRVSPADDPEAPGRAPLADPWDAGGEAGDLGIRDDRWLTTPDEGLVDFLAESASAASNVAGRCARVERALLSAARVTILLANSRGLHGEYEKTPALLSLSMTPAEPGARASIEERSGCSMDLISPRECGVAAALRSLPVRPAAAAPETHPPLILPPRVAASFLAAMLPVLLGSGAGPGLMAEVDPGGGPGPAVGSSLAGGLTLVEDGRAPGMVASGPFDGVGRRTSRTVLLRDGARCGRLSALDGHTVRLSYREPPRVGPATYILEAGAEGGGAADASLVAEVALLTPGPVRWRIRVLRGDWWTGGSPAGPADGLMWEGPPSRILAGLRPHGGPSGFFHPGMPIGAPPLLIEGLGPWIVEAVSRRPEAGPARAPAAWPSPPPEDHPV